MSLPNDRIIYLDYAATTPVDPRVAEKMSACLTQDGCFANPASSHRPGREARARVEHARAQLAALIGAEPRELIFTSGATESNNLAIAGAAHFHQHRGRHLITSRSEHKAVVDVFKRLEEEGFEVTWLAPDAQGHISRDQLVQALREDTILVSLMWVNNEIGVEQEIEAMAAETRRRGILFHVDAAQAVGKRPINLSQVPVDLLSLSGHKFYGPKGVGALYLRRRPRARVSPLMLGGGQERGLRSGTLATHQLVGLGEAAHLAAAELDEEMGRLKVWREQLLSHLLTLPGAALNSTSAQGVPGIVNLRFEGIHGEALVAALDPYVAVSSGSACTSAVVEPSYVLRALGLSEAQAEASLRISFGRFSNWDELSAAADRIEQVVRRLHSLSPRGQSDSGPTALSG
ncbi:cysteine desulfurase [Natronospira proteinivora]|uniref:cysteine desulfurase n=1 Tax=Natronospira proteinivora TaxID=1807133 RepID=A0ABT1G7R0_9GAMM|nr:aminotransferase class V-fold PLP-dependent enzyme [Natronospira proteinivora]MCP1727334.1 cysteine desulfurase [Natronospira proteinivora]